MFPQRRMTTDTPDGNYSQALNLFVRGEGGWVQMPSRSISLNDYMKQLIKAHNADIDTEGTPEEFDMTLCEHLFDGPETIEGLLAEHYTLSWALASLRDKLKHYEDALIPEIMPEGLQTIDRAIGTYGKDAQLTKAVEEMSELTKALCKLKECKRKYDTPFNRETQEVHSNIEEEIADADLEQVFEMVFLVTATGDYLTLKAEEYAVYRQAAATAKYRIKYDGELPELGTRFFCSGQYFVLAQDDALGIYIEAEKAGTEANDIPAGTSVVPTDTQRSLTACSIVEELEPGADDEDDESLRKRVQEKIAGPAENGNQQHYKTWCESISGVGRARIVPLWAGENTVKGVLIDTEGGPASEAVVQRVQEYIDPGGTGLGEGQANIGAHFTATSATAKRVNIWTKWGISRWRCDS